MRIPDIADIVIVGRFRSVPRATVDLVTEAEFLADNPGCLQLNAVGPGRLIVSEAYFPGWQASVDGQPHRVKPYKDIFLSVDLGEGKHKIDLCYSPFSFKCGACLTILTLLFLGGWFLLGGKVKIRSGRI